ncbi:MAG: hypothetical protein JOZ87_23505 [Chloroflexi bacterium]|nr:hypothetical protein [Chloroflexota bacterium]
MTATLTASNGRVPQGEASTPRLRRADAERDLHMLWMLNGGGLLGPKVVEWWFQQHPEVDYLRPAWLLLEEEVG